MTQFEKQEAPILLPLFSTVTDLRSKKYEQGVIYVAILEVLHGGKEALLQRPFCVDRMLISDFSMLIEKRYPQTFRGLWITQHL